MWNNCHSCNIFRMMLTTGKADTFLAGEWGFGLGLLAFNSRCGNNSLHAIDGIFVPLALKSLSLSSTDADACVGNVPFISFNSFCKIAEGVGFTLKCNFFFPGADSLYRNSFSFSDEKLNSPSASTPSLPSPSVTPCKGKLNFNSWYFFLNLDYTSFFLWARIHMHALTCF